MQSARSRILCGMLVGKIRDAELSSRTGVKEKGKRAQMKKTWQSNIWFATLSPRQQDLLLLRLSEACERTVLPRAQVHTCTCVVGAG